MPRKVKRVITPPIVFSFAAPRAPSGEPRNPADDGFMSAGASGAIVRLRAAASLVLRLLLVAVCAPAGAEPPPPAAFPQQLSFRVVASFPHDRASFTQGLLWHDGRLWESIGHYGRSEIRKVRLSDGVAESARELPREYFGEGLALAGGHLYQLTWREGVALVYDLALNLVARRAYQGEGWGLTTMPGVDGQMILAMSNGSSDLQMLEPATFAVVGRLHVRDRGRPAQAINELEYARGAIWANIWQTDRVVAIEPESGAVKAELDLSALRHEFELPPDAIDPDFVLNGIAYDPESDHFYVTGKSWPKLFEIAVTGR